jgi:hypothetical protein
MSDIEYLKSVIIDLKHRVEALERSQPKHQCEPRIWGPLPPRYPFENPFWMFTEGGTVKEIEEPRQDDDSL